MSVMGADVYETPWVYHVERATTDKLQDALNDQDWEVVQIQHVGGRDWVIISRFPDLNAGDDE